MMGKAKSSRMIVLLATTILTAVGGNGVAPQVAFAQTAQVYRFNIPAKPIRQAMNDIVSVSGIDVVFSETSAASAVGKPVSGTLTPSQAVAALLSGTGLSYRFTSSNTVTIFDTRQASASVAEDGATVLETITVQGGGNPNSTIGNLPEAYAGGQVARGAQVGMLGNRDVMNTPFSQTSYTRQTITDQQAQTVNEVLANDPSVLTKTRGIGNDTETIRGFLNHAYYGSRSLNGVSGMAPLVYPSADYIERVDVLKGPSALLNGMQASDGSPGGSVNLVTKKATDDPVTSITTRYMSDAQFGTHVDIGRRFGSNQEFGIRFNGSIDGGDSSVDTQRTRDRVAALSMDYRGDRVRLSADFAHQKQFQNPHSNWVSIRRAKATLTDMPKTPSVTTSLFPTWSENQDEGTLGMVQAEVDLTDNITAYGAIGAQKLDQFHSGTLQPQILNDAGDFAILPYGSRASFEMLSMQGGIRGTATTGAIDHAFNFHVSHARWELSSSYFFGDSLGMTNLYNPVFPAKYVVTDPGTPERDNVSKTFGIGFADTLSFFDERIQLTGGVRYQEVNINSAWAGEYDANAWTPSVALVVKPWDNVSLYANYIEGLQPGTAVDGTYANAGEVFAPYVSKQYEAGVKVDWGPVTTSLAVFQIAQPNLISIADAGGGLPTLALNGEQRNRGIELSAYGEVFDSVRLLGGVALLDSRQMKTEDGLLDGERGAGAPRVRAVIGGEWDTPFIEGLTLNGRLTFTSDQVAVAERPDLKLPSWTQVDLGARYSFQSPWNDQPIIVRFNVDNVFNKSYWVAPSTPDHIAMSRPRTFRLSTEFKF